MNKRILCPIVIGIFFNFLSSVLKKGVIRILLVPTLALLSTGVWSSASAATYNVRTDGSDSNCNGSANAPSSSAPNCAFKTVQKAANTASAGDKVNIQAGTYNETVTFNKSGSASAPITFNGSGSPIIRGNVHIKGSYTTVDGVTVSPPSAGGPNAVTLYGQHNTLRNCLVTNYGAAPQEQATAIGFDTSGSYNTVEGCTIKDLNDIDVFHVFGHDQTIRNNHVTNIRQTRYDLNHTDFIQTWGWNGNSSYNILVEGNMVTNIPAQLGCIETLGFSGVHDWTFRNNIFANVDNALFSGIPNAKYYNNVFYNVKSGVSLYNTPGTYSSAGDQFINNVFVGDSVGFHDSTPSGLVIKNNYFSGAPKGTDSINGGDPKFVNASGFDFHTQTGSVLIGKGADLSSLFTTDKDGNTRSAAWDIGSYQYKTGGTGGSTGALAAPSNLRIVP